MRHPSYILKVYLLWRLSPEQYHFLLKVVFFFFVFPSFIFHLITIFWRLRLFNYVDNFLLCWYFMLLHILIMLLKILILYKLYIFLLIMIFWAISIFYNLNTNIFRSKTFFHVIWAFLYNLISLQLIFQSPLSLGFWFSIETLIFIILALPLIIISNQIAIIIIMNNEINRDHGWEDTMLWWIRNLAFPFC